MLISHRLVTLHFRYRQDVEMTTARKKGEALEEGNYDAFITMVYG